MKTKINALAKYVGAAVVLGAISCAAQAEITVLKQDPQAGDPLSRLNFTVGGSIRPQFNNMTGDSDKGSYKRNGFDGGSRFRFTADYYLFDDISWISYYELGVNFPALFNWDHHYADGATDTTRRMLYTGLKSDTWGQLTFGQQNSVFYDVVGAKTDIWDYDMLGQAPGNGINGDYDGSYRTRKSLKYKKTVGDVDLYASYLFDDDLNRNDGKGIYKRKGGGSLGMNYHITDDLQWGAAWNYTKAKMRNYEGRDASTYNQNIWGTALSWTPDNWTLAAGLGWYQNYIPLKGGYSAQPIDNGNAFADDAWGYEYFIGYAFPINQYALQAIQPYVMGDRMEFVNGANWKRIDNGVGINFKFDYGFSMQYEHVFTSSTDDQGDMNLVRLRYDL